MATKKEVEALQQRLWIAEQEATGLKRMVADARSDALRDIVSALEEQNGAGKDVLLTLIRALTI